METLQMNHFHNVVLSSFPRLLLKLISCSVDCGLRAESLPCLPHVYVVTIAQINQLKAFRLLQTIYLSKNENEISSLSK